MGRMSILRSHLLRPTGVHLLTGDRADGLAALAALAADAVARGHRVHAAFACSPTREAAGRAARDEFACLVGVDVPTTVGTLAEPEASQLARRLGPGGLLVAAPDEGVCAGMGEVHFMATLNRAARTAAVVAAVPRHLRGRAEAVYAVSPGPVLTARGGANPVHGYGTEVGA